MDNNIETGDKMKHNEVGGVMPPKPNTNERLLYEILNEAYPGQWVSEHKGIEGRKFRFDCANQSLKIAIEIEGGVWVGGRHNTPIGMIQDIEKYNLAIIKGWRLLRYTPEMLKKTPWKLIKDVRLLCGVDDAAQTTLCLDGLKQTKLKEQLQVRLS